MIDWQLFSKLAYDLVLVAVCAVAIIMGRVDERLGAVIVVTASGATDVALPIGILLDIKARYLVAAVNILCLVAFDALMVRSRRFWPMWATGVQLAAVSLDAAMLLMPVEAGPYLAMRGKFAYLVLLALLIGALGAGRRDRPDPADQI